MYETVKVVNGYKIERMTGTRGFFKVYIRKNVYHTFRTIKAATAFCETLK